MSKWIIATLSLLMTSFAVAKNDPHLFFGANLGAGLMTVAPSDTPAGEITPLTRLLQGDPNASSNEYNKEAYLETSEVIKSEVQIAPEIGVLFPIGDNVQLQGAAFVDFTERDFKVSNKNLSNKGIAKITRDVGIIGSLLVRVSKQYSLGPQLEAHIVRNISPIFTNSKEREYFIYHVGFQSIYQFHESVAVSMAYTTTLDETFSVGEVLTDHPLKLSYQNTKVSLTFLIMPI